MLLSDLHPTFADPFEDFDACLLDMLANLRGGREESRVGFGGMWFEENGGHECLGWKINK